MDTIRYVSAFFLIFLFAAPAAQAQIYVDVDAPTGGDGSSWGSALVRLRDAITLADSTDEIWIAEGTYVPTASATDQQANFYVDGAKDGLEIYGGFAGNEMSRDARDPVANRTVLSGDIDGDATLNGNTYHVVLFDGVNGGPITSETVLSGVTVTGGNAVGGGSDSQGGGIYCEGRGEENECSPTLENLTFVDNHAEERGGALYNIGQTNGESSPTIIGSFFVDNSAGRGGAIHNDGLDGASSPAISNSVFTENTADAEGGAIYNDGIGGASNPTFTNVTFSENTATDGDAIYSTSYNGGASNASIINSIFYPRSIANTDPGSEIYAAEEAAVTLRHVLMEGGCAAVGGNAADCGPNVSDTDPQFVRAYFLTGPDGVYATADDGLRLGPGSPALDAGDNSAVAASEDVTGAERIQDGAVDLGAYESVPLTPLSLDLTASLRALREGESSELTLSLTNDGPDVATNVEVYAPPVDGLTLQPATDADNVEVNSDGLSWRLDVVASGETASVQLSADVDFDEQKPLSEQPLTFEASIGLVDQENPPAGDEAAVTLTPNILSATQGRFEDRVRVSWTSLNLDDVEYRVLRGGELVSVLSSEDTSYVDRAIDPGRDYEYCLDVDYPNGDVARWGCADGQRTISPPAGVSASDRTYEQFVRVTWRDSSDVETGYDVYRNDQLLVSLSEDAVSYDDTSAVAGTIYDYCVEAVDAEDFASERGCDEGERGFVLPPANVSASDGQYDDAVVVTWRDQTDMESGYLIYRKEIRETGDGALIDSVDADEQTYEDGGAISGVDYTYCVRTRSQDGGLSTSVCDAGIRGRLPAPTRFAATDSTYDDRVELIWTDRARTEDAYQIFRKKVNRSKDSTLIAETPSDATSYDDTEAVPGVTYRYYLRATAEEGGASAFATDTGYRSVVLTPEQVRASSEEYEDRVEIAWTSTATRANLFRIFRDGERIKTVPADQTTYADYEIASGVSYEYCVEAATAQGAPSTRLGCDAGSRLIAPPENLAAADDNPDNEAAVRLTWNDASRVETGYRVFRREADAAADSTLLATLPENRTVYADSTAAPGVRYQYAVTAFDSLGASAPATDAGSRRFGAPTQFTAADGEAEQRVELAWLDQASAEAGYYVYRTDPSAGAPDPRTAAPYDSLGASATSYTDAGVEPGARYRYTIAPYDRHGASSGANDEGFTVILPAASVNASMTYADSVVVTWVDNSDIETGYEITRDGSVLTTTDPDMTAFTDDGATGMHEYCVTTLSDGQSAEANCDAGQTGGSGPPVSEDITIPASDRLAVSGGSSTDDFGTSVDVSGNYAIVGKRAGAYVYHRSENGTWSEQSGFDFTEIIKGSYYVSIDVDGLYDFAVVGDPYDDGNDEVVVLNRDGESWYETKTFTSAGDVDLGRSVAINGDYILAGAPGASGGGAVYVYKLESKSWSKTVTITADNTKRFGARVALDGNRAVISDVVYDSGTSGRSSQDKVYFFERSGDSWDQQAVVDENASKFGAGVAVSGDYALVGAPRANKAYVYFYREGSWQKQDELVGSAGGGDFGASVDIRGADAVIGAPLKGVTRNNRTTIHEGVTNRFQRVGTDWHQRARLLNGETYSESGTDVALDADLILTGAPRTNVDGTRSGAAYYHSYTPAANPPTPPKSPGEVAATDGTEDNRVDISWTDRATTEDGYRVYRNGERIAAGLPADETSYSDEDAPAGEVSRYCVTAYTEADGDSNRACDFGRRPPDGALTGRVTTRQGAAVDSVGICLNPTPGRALQLDGTVESYALTEGVSLPSDELTVSFWVRSSDKAKEGSMFSYGALGSGANSFLIDNHRNVGIYVHDDDAGDSDVDLSDGNWHHVAGTWRSSDGRVELYVDGELALTNDGIAQGETLASDGAIVFGQDQDALGGGFAANQALEGLMDEVRVWNYARNGDEIRAAMDRPLTGDEDGLVSYWPVERGGGPALADETDDTGERYAAFNGGAYRSDQSAPIQACGRSDGEGNYALNGIRYGNETTFEVTPSLGERDFDPAFKSITLSEGNPVENEVGFTDVSSFTVAGAVQYEDTQCFVENASILSDGDAKGTTTAEGTYAVPVSLGERTISVEKDAHTFSGPQTLNVTSNRNGVNFADRTTRTLGGRIGGGCGIGIGDVTLKIKSESGCFEKTVTANGNYSVQGLPPLTYNVIFESVDNVPNGVEKADIIAYFDQVGAQQVDLTQADTTLDITYRAPLAVSVEGFPEPTKACQAGLAAGGETLPNVPIIEQGPDVIPLTLSVNEDYGSAGLCPVDSGSVEVFDEIADRADDGIQLPIKEGKAIYATVANSPALTGRTLDGVNRTYQKALEVNAEAGARTAQTTRYALVTGRKLREGSQFITGRTGEIPLEILRDPPGDASQTIVEKGTSFCKTLSSARTTFGNLSATVSAKAGFEFRAGLGFSTKTELSIDGGTTFTMTTTSTESGGTQVCATTQESFSTSDGETFVGDQGDVFIGTAMNLVFAETDVLEANGCRIDQSTAVAFEPNGFETTYAFTRYHIENSILPQLSEFISRFEDSAPDTSRLFRNDSLLWQQHLLLNDSLKAAATVSENRSFSAGADYAYQHTIDSTSTTSWETTLRLENETFFGIELEAAGNGFKFEMSGGGGTEDVTGGDSTRTDTRTVGYTLSDDDIGDNFTVDVKDDPVFNTPVFDLRAGASSCPWEGPITRLDGTEIAGTSPRDAAKLSITPKRQDNLPPGETADYTLSLTNQSATDETREYVLRQVQTANTDGARLSINGGALNGAISYFLDPGPDGTQRVTLGVDRGPVRYRYEDLGLILTPPCEYANWENGGPLQQTDSLSFTANFKAPCSEISLLRPLEDWTINASSDSLEVVFDEFSLVDVDGNALQQLGLEYRRQGSTDWLPAGAQLQRTRKQLLDGVADPENVMSYAAKWDFPAPDGEYELRAYTSCDTGDRVFSPVVSGLVDTRRPEVLDAPEPADGVLALGDDISIPFTEPVSCPSVVTQGADPNVLLYAASDTLGIRATCNEKRMVIRPLDPTALETYEDSVLTAEVRGTLTQGAKVINGVTDLAGNPLQTDDPQSDTEQWSFRVRRRAFAWADAAVSAEIPFEEGGRIDATLVNGSPEPVVYSLESEAAGDDFADHWFQIDETSSTVPVGSEKDLSFSVSDTLSKGTYRDTVVATTALGPERLAVSATVDCRAPFGDPPANLAYSMNLTARLDVPPAVGGSGVSTDTTDVVAAYVGSELRGVAPVQAEQVDGQARYLAFLTVGSDVQQGETVTLRLWDASQCAAYNVAETFPFFTNATYGSIATPEQFTATDDQQQAIDLPGGWTWFSTNKRQPDGDQAVGAVLSTVTPVAGDVVKNQSAYSQYSAQSGWVGPLNAIQPGEAYLVRLTDPATLLLLGEQVQPQDTTLDLTSGWNWLGYLPQAPLPLNEALAGLAPEPKDGDVIKSQFAFAQYVAVADQWIGSLETMQPGRGYLMRLSKVSELTYPGAEQLPSASVRLAGQGLRTTSPPEAGVQKQATAPSVLNASKQNPPQQLETAQAADTTGPHWSVAPSQYPDAIPMVASVMVDGINLDDPYTRLGAFIDEEVRGIGKPVYVEALDAYRVFMMVYGDASEDAKKNLTLRIYDAKSEHVYEDAYVAAGLPSVERGHYPRRLDPHFGGVMGKAEAPVIVNAGTLPESALPQQFSLQQNFPNPFNRRSIIRYALPRDAKVTLTVYDVLGRRVRKMVDEERPAGWHTTTINGEGLASGVYFYRIKAGSFVKDRRMVVVR